MFDGDDSKSQCHCDWPISTDIRPFYLSNVSMSELSKLNIVCYFRLKMQFIMQFTHEFDVENIIELSGDVELVDTRLVCGRFEND